MALTLLLLTPTAPSVKAWEAKRDARTLEVQQRLREGGRAVHATRQRAANRWLSYEAHCRYGKTAIRSVRALTCSPLDSWGLNTMTRNGDRWSGPAGVTARCLQCTFRKHVFPVIAASAPPQRRLSCLQYTPSNTIFPAGSQKARRRLRRSLQTDRLDFLHLHRQSV